MRTTGSKRYGASSWLIGALVLIALSLAVTWMLNKGDRVGASLRDGKGQQDHVVAPELPRLMKDVSTAQRADDVIVRGLVLTPSGGPAVSATVTLYRLITGWPEWRRERVDEAITHEEGAFQFRCPHYHGFLVRYEHSQYAGGFEEVPLLGNSMRLQLQPGFAISGFVINDVGAPVPNARVSVESVLGERRRASHALTAADGSYNFQNLAAGPARLPVPPAPSGPRGRRAPTAARPCCTLSERAGAVDPQPCSAAVQPRPGRRGAPITRCARPSPDGRWSRSRL